MQFGAVGRPLRDAVFPDEQGAWVSHKACCCRHPQVIVSTDVLARGVDLDRINLVVNMDLPVSALRVWGAPAFAPASPLGATRLGRRTPAMAARTVFQCCSRRRRRALAASSAAGVRWGALQRCAS